MNIILTTALLALASLPLSAKPELIESSARFLSADGLNGREAGSAGNLKARDYLVEKLKALGVSPAGDEGSFLQSYNGGSNVLGILYPNDTQAQSRPTVLMGAHFDHVDHCHHSKLARSKVCNGAADNAAAVAAILGAVEDLRGKIHSPVAIAFWDGEEKGLKGSRAFVKSPSFETSDLRLYINLDIIGLNLFRGAQMQSFVIGAESGGEELKEQVKQATHGEDVNFHLLSYSLGHYRSDMTSFVLSEKPLPFVFFTDGDGTVYHTDADEFENLNLAKINSISRSIARLAKFTSTEKEGAYVYSAPEIKLKNNSAAGFLVGSLIGLRNGAVLPLQDDARALLPVLDVVIQNAELNELSDKKIANLEQTKSSLEFYAQLPAENFGPLQALKVGLLAQGLLELSHKLPFIP